MKNTKQQLILSQIDEKRKDYIRAIKIAEKHDLHPLMAFAKS